MTAKYLLGDLAWKKCVKELYLTISVSIMKIGAVVEEDSARNVVIFRESAIAECSRDVCYKFSSVQITRYLKRIIITTDSPKSLMAFTLAPAT